MEWRARTELVNPLQTSATIVEWTDELGVDPEKYRVALHFGSILENFYFNIYDVNR